MAFPIDFIVDRKNSCPNSQIYLHLSPEAKKIHYSPPTAIRLFISFMFYDRKQSKEKLKFIGLFIVWRCLGWERSTRRSEKHTNRFQSVALSAGALIGDEQLNLGQRRLPNSSFNSASRYRRRKHRERDRNRGEAEGKFAI